MCLKSFNGFTQKSVMLSRSIDPSTTRNSIRNPLLLQALIGLNELLSSVGSQSLESIRQSHSQLWIDSNIFSELLGAQFTVIKRIHVSQSEHLMHSEFHLFHLLSTAASFTAIRWTIPSWVAKVCFWFMEVTQSISQSFKVWFIRVSLVPLTEILCQLLAELTWELIVVGLSEGVKRFYRHSFAEFTTVTQGSICFIIHYPFSDTGDTQSWGSSEAPRTQNGRSA